MKLSIGKIKENKLLLTIFGVIVFGLLVFFLYFYDIGLNSKYFVRKDFSKAFLLRQTGNCEEFVKYINQDWANWVSRCYGEKNRVLPSQIKSFEVKQITTNGGRSFLQVEIQRDSPRLEILLKDELSPYVVNYEMKRINGRWLIDQPINK